MANDSDLYALLGVSRTAAADDIRSAYRKLAKLNHPDVNPGNKAAEERFKSISAAYDVLSDVEKRKLYDEFGAAGLREGFDAEQARAYGRQARGQRGGGQPFESGGADFDLGDMFGDFFGGRSASRSRPRSGRGVDMAATVDIDLLQALQGTEIHLQVPSHTPCPVCQGRGTEAHGKPVPCTDCHGRGTVQAVQGPVSLKTRCPSCGGTGERIAPCGACGGSGQARGQDVVTVRIPPGADNGSKLRVAGRGAKGQGGAPPGDLVIETRVRPHPFFRRDGLDLHLRLPVTVTEAYLGAGVDVPTPTGQVSLKVPPHSQQGSTLRLRGKGVRRGAQSGDLYVELEIHVPDSDDPAVAEAVQVLARGYSKDVRGEVKL